MSDPAAPGAGDRPPDYGQYPPPYGRPQIDRHVGWFVVSWLFLWPRALYSLLSAFLNIDRALAVGDIAGAQYQAERVRKHGIIALTVGVAWLVIVFALFVAVGTSAGSGHVCVGTSNC
ncbi:MAG TPA: CD225/dispanin family protein [Jatrophihabitantaceae bacterium]|nr:CD225/dispanin family protein [Jatrophihabitantaceae bacterium]